MRQSMMRGMDLGRREQRAYALVMPDGISARYRGRRMMVRAEGMYFDTSI